MAISVPAGAPLTYRDLAGSPDDGRRRELVEGTLVVTPGVVDPDPPVALTVFTLAGDDYRISARARGDESWSVDEPFRVTVVPTRLLET